MKRRLHRCFAFALMAAPAWIGTPVAALQTSDASAVVGRQSRGGPAPTQVAVAPDSNAEQTREQLMNILEAFPPELARVLRLDPSLAANPTYLAPYPRLSAFLTQHPEVARNPSYFFGRIPGPNSYDSYPRQSASSRLMEQVLAGAAIITGFTIALLSLGWFIRTVIDYRRWHRLARVQSEAHNKLLDRFSANAELIAYIESPAGSQFLQSAPIALDPGARRLGAPISRIFWSVQAGLVLIMGGLGLQYVSGRITDLDAQQACYAVGILAMALGAGFVISAGVAYLLSKKLGLFQAAPETENFKLKTQN